MKNDAGGVTEKEEAALDGFADDFAFAEPAIEATLKARYLGGKRGRMNSEDRHRIGAEIARKTEAQSRR